MRPYVVTLLIAITLAGCYTPLPEHGLVSGRAMITPAQLRAIDVGSHTREDILMQFGDPSRILADGDVFVYDWERVTGWFTFAVGYGVGGSENVTQVQHFVVAFDQKSVVVHADLIDPLVWQSSEKKLQRVLEEWRSAESK